MKTLSAIILSLSLVASSYSHPDLHKDKKSQKKIASIEKIIGYDPFVKKEEFEDESVYSIVFETEMMKMNQINRFTIKKRAVLKDLAHTIVHSGKNGNPLFQPTALSRSPSFMELGPFYDPSLNREIRGSDILEKIKIILKKDENAKVIHPSSHFAELNGYIFTPFEQNLLQPKKKHSSQNLRVDEDIELTKRERALLHYLPLKDKLAKETHAQDSTQFSETEEGIIFFAGDFGDDDRDMFGHPSQGNVPSSHKNNIIQSLNSSVTQSFMRLAFLRPAFQLSFPHTLKTVTFTPLKATINGYKFKEYGSLPDHQQMPMTIAFQQGATQDIITTRGPSSSSMKVALNNEVLENLMAKTLPVISYDYILPNITGDNQIFRFSSQQSSVHLSKIQYTHLTIFLLFILGLLLHQQRPTRTRAKVFAV